MESFDQVGNADEEMKRSVPPGSLFLTGEDDIQDDPRVGYAKVCRFIGIEPGDPEIPYKRTNPITSGQTISNFKELRAALKGRKHEWMPDD